MSNQGRASTFGRRISKPILVGPRKEGEECAFSKGCSRDCTHASPLIRLNMEIAELLKNEIRKAADALKRAGTPKSDAEMEERHRNAKNLIMMLQGSVVPLDEGGWTIYGTCGEPAPGSEFMKAMQVFTIDEMRQVVKGMDLSLSLEGAYASASPRGMPLGLDEYYSMLLARISFLHLPKNPVTLDNLIKNGGVGGIETLARMAGEPTLDFDSRIQLVWAMGRALSCASYSEGNTEVINPDNAAPLSRFMFIPLRAVSGELDGDQVGLAYYGKDAPPVPEKPELGMLRNVISFSIGQIFQAVMNMAGRLDELSSASEKAIHENMMLAQELYICVKNGVHLLAGKKMQSRQLLQEFCERKRIEYADRGMEPGEQSIVKYAAAGLIERGKLDPESASALDSVLSAGEADAALEPLLRLGVLVKEEALD